MLQSAQKSAYNPMIDAIERHTWDGVPRLATFFHDWLGCKQNAYHAELATVWFTAGVARLYEPGHRFDLVPILGGKQGGGKSGLIEEIGMGFGGALSGDYHDTQKMAESTMGKSVLEVPELKGMTKGMIEDIKHYFTGTQDTVRLAYRRNPEDFKRMCIYMGTTNQAHYLRDEENRRFCPVLTTTHRNNVIKFDGPNGVKAIIPQLWAEARVNYLQMRKDQPRGFLPLHFTSPEAKREALRLQTESRETMAYEPVLEVIEEWVNRPIDGDFDDDEGESDEKVRNLVTVTMIRQSLKDDPIIRELRGAAAEKVIGQALQRMAGFQALGRVRRLNSQARWYSRIGQPDTAQYAPMSAVITPENEAPAASNEIEDLLS